jgi:hypothetical protein
MIVLLVVGAVLLAGFVVAEARAAEPILPLAIFRNRVVRSPARSASSSVWRCSGR